jgi:glucose-1-phosphate thymidylyltransferase
MKVIVLTAGLGTRLRPHTYSKPKPLLSVAGKPVIGHIIDTLAPLTIDELICVYGYLGSQIEGYLRKAYDYPMRFVEQADPKGQAHAIYLCKEFISGPTLIIFGDGLFGVDLERLNSNPDTGVIYVQEVDDPSRFGVAVVENGLITKLVEKPSTPVSNLAIIGVYYLPDGQRLMDAIAYCMEHNIQTKGEYYLADALEVMIQRGERFTTDAVHMWKDAGTVPAVIDTHRYLLENGHSRTIPTTNSAIIPPVHLADGAIIENSVVGPYVSVGEGAVVRNSVVRDSLIYANATVEDANLQGSLVGERAQVSGASQVLNIGDTAVVRG